MSPLTYFPALVKTRTSFFFFFSSGQKKRDRFVPKKNRNTETCSGNREVFPKKRGRYLN